MYSEAFCKIYNEFGWNYYPEAFSEELMHWIRANDVPVKKVMDLGCGTGVLCEALLAQEIEAEGMDLSEEMIAIARKRNPEIHYQVANMITFRPMEKYDLVTCTGDALNHITSLSDVETIFRNVHDYLSPDGYFVFDLLNENEIEPDDPIDMDWDENTRARFLMTREADGTVHLSVSVYENGELQFEEVITEIVHDTFAIRELLRKTGFRLVRIDHSLMDDQPGKGLTWFVIAQRV